MATNRAQRRAAQKKFKLEEFRDQAIEAMSQVSSILLECEDGFVVEIPHPMLVDDDTQERIEQFQRGDGLDREPLIDPETGDPILDEAGEPLTRIKEPHQINGVICEPISTRSAKAILGDEQHADFLAHGGHSNDVTLAWQWMVSEHKKQVEADPKETKPFFS